ncbi:MAG: DUF1161 domain-containing protein [Proteobacteria bacterium]|nr:DUF1161 domain-containing protein [Pseudomonadota bacterium]MBU4469492.1 DUF1161 domain-containing protein [Pseudomonadota bacterium]MCG2752391.1 DUF1161 domain-containing protein [Desulfobacteraceae bacterium]
MKRIILFLVSAIVFFNTPAFAEIKSCEELKAEIDAKLKAKGVKGYNLEILPADQVTDQKIVGSCNGGTMKISYSRNKE